MTDTPLWQQEDEINMLAMVCADAWFKHHDWEAVGRAVVEYQALDPSRPLERVMPDQTAAMCMAAFDAIQRALTLCLEKPKRPSNALVRQTVTTWMVNREIMVNAHAVDDLVTALVRLSE